PRERVFFPGHSSRPNPFAEIVSGSKRRPGKEGQAAGASPCPPRAARSTQPGIPPQGPPTADPRRRFSPAPGPGAKTMTRANKALAVLVVAALGLWGCAQGPANGAGSAERIKALEGKCAKLEDDYRAVASARDQLRKKLAEADEQRGRLKA